MITQSYIQDKLDHGEVQFSPLTISKLKIKPPEAVIDGLKIQADALIDMTWEQMSVSFVAECRPSASPRAFKEALNRITKLAARVGLFPLLIVPYLRPEQLDELQRVKVSAIDLSGNGVVLIPGRILLVRTGEPNGFKDSRSIGHVYRGDSSMVARSFLLCPQYRQVNDVWNEIRLRSGHVALSTVSKVLKQLFEDLIVGRSKGDIRLLQAEKLMDHLAGEYRAPLIKERLIGRAFLVDNQGAGLGRAVEQPRATAVVSQSAANDEKGLLERLAAAAAQSKTQADSTLISDIPGSHKLQSRGLLERLAGIAQVKRSQPAHKEEPVAITEIALEKKIALAAKDLNARVALSGISSVAHYLPGHPSALTSIYCSERPSILLQRAGIGLDQHHCQPNLELIETDDQVVYFDLREHAGCPFASPLQAWLELMHEGQEEIAERIKAHFLDSAPLQQVECG